MKYITILIAFLSMAVLQAGAQDLPRPEYPRPQFEREEWMNLNGAWTCEFDYANSGYEKGYPQSKSFDQEIIVPYCPESKLSGIEHRDFIPAMWYHRQIEIPEEWAGQRILLHFGAVDYQCEIFIDGQQSGMHFGGSTPFALDISELTKVGQRHDLVIHVEDDTRSRTQPGGKQSQRLKSAGCSYTRTTGIWQTVWMEAVDKNGLSACQTIADPDAKRFVLLPEFYAIGQGYSLEATLFYNEKEIAKEKVPVSANATLVLPTGTHTHLWSPDNPALYDIELVLRNSDNETVDVVKSYVGMRKLEIRDGWVLLNGEPLYQRLVLDQGFYPEGVWTAPTDEDLKQDILLAKKAGFNGARLHQKVFEPRYHYWADKLGFITWGESASWGLDLTKTESARNFLKEWGEIIVRDRNHPSIIAWTPFNESWYPGEGEAHYRVHKEAYMMSKRLDPTRPVNNASGGIHVITDLWTEHTYIQDPDQLKAALSPIENGKYFQFPKKSSAYTGQPYLLDEYGGIRWSEQIIKTDTDAWGYGDDPKTKEEFYERLEALTKIVLRTAYISGFCYTQLTDVEQEQNGIYNYDRSDKFDMERIRNIFTIERER